MTDSEQKIDDLFKRLQDKIDECQELIELCQQKDDIIKDLKEDIYALEAIK